MTTVVDPQVSDIEKFQLEVKKYKLLVRTFYVDLFSKIAIPVGLLAVAWTTYDSNVKAAADRMSFDVNTKKIELTLRERELFNKTSDSNRLVESVKATFIQNNFDKIISASEDTRKAVDVLVRNIFNVADAQDVLVKIEQIRSSVVLKTSSNGVSTASSFEAYKQSGLSYFKLGQYSQAFQEFSTATILNPTDPEAWNFKAYSEWRLGNFDDAYNSISTSIRLKPSEPRLQGNVAINASKILCSLGRKNDALLYMKQNLALLPSLNARVQGDAELLQGCGWFYPKK